ncbi:MAG TPA: hypothetical protein DEG69_09980 [Flavobacteriaceae bacterium]|nr:hypothetical protein [Flavobacteriaceae bacterium]
MNNTKLANAQILEASGAIRKHYFENEFATLKELQGIVGGNIELLRLKDDKIMIVNEDGLNLQLDLNKAAINYLYDFGISDIPIVGNVLVIDSVYLR